MKIQHIKQEVYRLTCTANISQLKKERPDLTRGRNLRTKQQWLEILEQLKDLRANGQDLSLADLEASEQMLKDSLFEVGRLVGLDDREIELDWQGVNAMSNSTFDALRDAVDLMDRLNSNDPLVRMAAKVEASHLALKAAFAEFEAFAKRFR